jgi:hypothetical protein
MGVVLRYDVAFVLGTFYLNKQAAPQELGFVVYGVSTNRMLLRS